MLRALVCFLLLVSGGSRAFSQPPRRVSLHFTRGEQARDCIDPISLASKVEQLTGPVLVAPTAAEAAVEVQLEGQEGGFRAVIRLANAGERAHGERLLEHRGLDCRDFDAALAFVIATTIDPDLVLEQVGALFDPNDTPPPQTLLDQPVRLPADPVDVAPKRPPEPKPVVPVVPLPAPRLTRWFGLGLTVSSELSDLALGPALSWRRQLSRWFELGAVGRAVFASRATELEVGTAKTMSLAGALLLCPRWPLASSLALAACVGPELALLRAAGFGLDSPEAGLLVSWGAALRPEVSVQLRGPYSLGLSGLVRLGPRAYLAYRIADERRTLLVRPQWAFGGELSVRRTF